jgi:type IV secretory pathway VirB2 component (pilin)
MTEHPDDASRPPPRIAERARTTWTGPVGLVLAIIFVILVLMAVLG